MPGRYAAQDVTLTPEQIKNWRRLMAGAYGLGPYALICPESEVQAFHDLIQAKLNRLGMTEADDGPKEEQ